MSLSGRQNLRRYYQCVGDRPSTSTAQYGDIMMPPSRSSGIHPQYVSPSSSVLHSSANELQISNPPPYSSSPLSDSLLLALRRSRPNTRLFRALFQYMPIRDSPNENPHLELPLQAGDYVLVHGQMDEDQFYFGETLNGRTGLVPSNYVERVPDHVLLQNASRAPSPVTGLSTSLTNISCCEASTSNATCGGANRSNATIHAGNTVQPGFLATNDKLMSSGLEALNSSSGCGGISGSISGTLPRVGSPSFVLNVPPHHAKMVHDFTDPELAPLPDSVCPYPPVDVSKVTVQEVKQPDQPRVPYPREITIEKKLSRSAVISWLPPEDKLIAVSQYHVCADGVVKAVVPGTYKCKALIEDLNLDKCVNISVRAVTEHGHSPDAACTIAIGTEAPVAPQHVRVSSITPISACLSWYPSNANAEHVVLLNAIKVGVCPPSVFQVQLQGLSPSTIYRVSVRTKHPKAVLEQRPVERCVDFKTLPKIGLPDPPAHVQVEVGPQPGTLLVSWKPVNSQPRPPSRAAVHSYLVFADGRNIAQVPSATADHVLLRLADFADDPPIFITVRTRTREGAISADSNVVRVPRGISAANPNVLAPGDRQLPFSSSIAVNTATAPLATASMPNSLIGGVIGSQPQHYELVQSAMNTIAMPYSIAPNSAISVGSAPSGLLTTLPQQSQQLQQAASQAAGSHQLQHSAIHGQQHQMYNTAYPLNQGPLYQSSQNAANAAALYCATAGPLSSGLLNGSTNAAKLVDWKQQQQSAAAAAAVAAHQQQQQRSQVQPTAQGSSQYYTFHPKSLFKEFTGVDDKPSVLEMENNYLLKHRQQQRDRELGSLDRWPGAGASSTLNRYDYYGTTRSNGRYDDMVRALPSTRPLMMQGGRKPTAIPPRLERVRSEEILGTRSEPDLRPLAITDDEENCRWFVALFDYDHMMSPNPNAQQEELSFRRHQLIKVYGEVDQDGFYRGQIGRRFGLVPSNMVIEIAKDDLMPQRRRSDAYPVEPAIRRMRWGSLKSRSYDHAGDRHRRGIIPGATYTPSQAHMVGPSVMPGAPMYSSLDRREQSLPPYSRYYDRAGYEHQPTSGRSYGRNYGYGYTGASRDYPQRDHHYDDRAATLPPGPSDIYDRGLPRDYRRGAPPLGDDYGRDAYPPMWGEYGGEGREPRDRDYRYEHGPPTNTYDDDRYPSQGPRGPLRRDYQRYSADGPPPGQLNQPPQQDHYDMQAPGAGGMMQQQGQYGQGRYPPQQQQQQQQPQQQPGQPADDRFVNVNGESTQVQKAIAKYDYDPKHCSPNVDAEQVELTFRQGDTIIIYGDRDDDGFYLGELNGKRGMVPYNFLQLPGQSLIAPPPNTGQAQITAGGPAQQPQSIMVSGGAATDMPAASVRPKGVAFSETTGKKPPTRQISQTSNKVGSTTSAASGSAGAGATGAKGKVAGAAGAGGAAKTLTKKASDLGTKGAAASVARKSSQAAKKADGKKK